MPRNMSFRLTTQQIQQRTKTVTRRFGWYFLKPGDLVQPVRQGQGLKPGQKVQKLGPPIRIVSVRQEPLDRITQADVVREGFPGMTPNDFLQMFLEKYPSRRPMDEVNRIEFEYTDG